MAFAQSTFDRERRNGTLEVYNEEKIWIFCFPTFHWLLTYIYFFNLGRFISVNLGRLISVQHCFPWWPGLGCTNSQVLSWLELTVRSYTSTAPQVRCSNRASSDGKKFLALPGVELGPFTPGSRPQPLCHTAPLI